MSYVRGKRARRHVVMGVVLLIAVAGTACGSDVAPASEGETPTAIAPVRTITPSPPVATFTPLPASTETPSANATPTAVATLAPADLIILTPTPSPPDLPPATVIPAPTDPGIATPMPTPVPLITPTPTPAPTVVSDPTPIPTSTAIPTQTATPTPLAPPSTTPSPVTTSADANIIGFAHQNVFVTRGATITWTNQDNAPHTVTAGAAGALTGGFDSGSFGIGGTYSQTFAAAGQFPYFCTVHPFMQATVIVQ